VSPVGLAGAGACRARVASREKHMAHSALLAPTSDTCAGRDRTVGAQLRPSAAAIGADDAPTRARRPGWLLIGSTGRNSGKTEFACAVIRGVRGSYPIVGVKVTAIVEGESICPRGGGGCGVCAALHGDFEIDEEMGEHAGKDTARMLESGAHRVFWVRCRRQRMHAAIAALLTRLDPGTLVVAESNSLAWAIEPDLFLMVTNGRSSSVKPTAADVMPLAHRLVRSADGAFDPSPRHLAAVDGTWHLAEASAVILAGGKSSRMGRDKSLLQVNGAPLIRRIHEQLARRFDEILIGTNEAEKYAFLGARTVRDLVPGKGPLMGIASAVEAARHDRVFVTACDIPVVDADTVARMLVMAENADCVIPVSTHGREPLFAVYRKSAVPAMHDALESGERRIDAVFPRVRTRFFDLGRAPWYRNLNTQDDVAAFLAAR
jgi:molybdopterin-guanine dinucleotide biosynthesis protein A